MTLDQIQALELFSKELPAGGKVLYAPGESAPSPAELQTSEWFRSRGYETVELPASKDLRFLSPTADQREAFDAVWCGRGWVSYSLEESQRIASTFLQMLRPRTGVIYASYLASETEIDALLKESDGTVTHQFRPDAFAPMLRQSGFRILAEGRQQAPETWVAVIARRA